MPRRPLLPALVAALGVAASTLAGVGSAPPAQAAASAAAPAVDRPALDVVIDSLAPAVLPERGPLRVSGSVSNRDDVDWAAIKLYALLGTTPMSTEEELAAAAASDPELVVGERIVEEDAADDIAEIAPGESARFSLTVPRSLLQTSGDGVYWFAVHALGESSTQPRDEIADGRARTFLPYRAASSENRASIPTALVLPLRRYLPYADDGSLDQVDRLTTNLTAGGRLRDLVDFAASAGDTPVTMLLDPALPDAVARLAAGNPPRSLGPTDPPPGADDGDSDGDQGEEDPGDGDEDGEPAPGLTASPEGQPTREPEQPGETPAHEPTPQERIAAEAATSWLGRFAAAVADREVLTLPYGDLDVPAAAAEPGSPAYDLARARPGRVLARLTAPREEGGDADEVAAPAPPAALIPAAGAPSGYLDPAGFGLLDDQTTVVLSDLAFGDDAPGTAVVDGHAVVVASSAAAEGGPGPSNRLSTLQLRQRILSEALLRTEAPGRPPLVVVMPQPWLPTDATSFFSGLDAAGWLDLTSLTEATRREGRVVPSSELVYPRLQTNRQLTSTSFDAFDDLVAAGETLQNLLRDNDEVSTTVTDQALAGLSYAARDVQGAARFQTRASTAAIESQLDEVRIDGGPGNTLSGADGSFSAVITNGLDQPVTVGVETLSSDGALEIAPLEPLQIAARGRATVVFDVHANTSGVSNLTLRLTDVEGNPLGASDTLPIRSAQLSQVIWLIIGTGLGLLFLAIVVRLVRRVRRARRPATVLDPAADDPADEPGDHDAASAPVAPAPREGHPHDRLGTTP